MDERKVDLDRRRGWARVRAIVACLAGVAVFAASAAALAMIVVGAMARAWSWATDEPIAEAPVWSWAPGGAGALGAVAIVVCFGAAFWYFWRGAAPQVLAEVAAAPLAPGSWPQLANVVEELSIGLGRPVPALWVTDDPAPNALSLHSNRRRAVVVTSGCSVLTRDELEALCAHELGHLWARDSHWVTSGLVALARARRFGAAVVALGTLLLVGVAAFAHYTDVVLWSTGLVAVLVIALGWASRRSLRGLERSVRRGADEIADVAAVRLARNPESLAAVCARLAREPARVSPVGWRSEMLWFESVELSDTVVPDAATIGEVAHRTLVAHVNSRGDAELVRRAVSAYREAGVPVPEGLLGTT